MGAGVLGVPTTSIAEAYLPLEERLTGIERTARKLEKKLD